MMYEKRVVEHASQVKGQMSEVREQEPKTCKCSNSSLYLLPFTLVMIAALTLLFLSCAQDNTQDPDDLDKVWIDHAPTGAFANGESNASGTSSASAVLGTPGTPLVYGGQTYKTVVIGNQTWMAENLNYATASGSYCDANTANYCATYGRVYNWATAQTVCPSGWHLPTDAEWQTLEMALGMDATTAATSGSRGTDQGTKLKANSSLWSTNTGTNTSGFSVLPGGIFFYKSFSGIGSTAFFWTTTETESSWAWTRNLGDSYANVTRNTNSKGNGYSVRCIKNSN